VICQGFAERSVTDVGGIFGQLGVEYRAGAFRGYSAVWQSADLLGGSVSSNAQGLGRRKAFQDCHLGTFSQSIPCAIPDRRFAEYRAKRERIGTGLRSCAKTKSELGNDTRRAGNRIRVAGNWMIRSGSGNDAALVVAALAAPLGGWPLVRWNSRLGNSVKQSVKETVADGAAVGRARKNT
jgi:hypothetical protein